MIRHRRYVGGHYASRVNEVHGVLDEGAGAGVRVVGGPDLVAVAERSVVHAAAAGRAALHNDAGVFLPYSAHDIVQSLNIFHKEAVLLCAKIRAAEALDNPVAVPFYVVDAGCKLHSAVKYAEHEVLYGRVGKVQHPLVSALIDFTAGALDNPFRVLVGKVGGRIHHFWLYPYAEFKPFGMSVRRHILNSFRKL